MCPIFETSKSEIRTRHSVLYKLIRITIFLRKVNMIISITPSISFKYKSSPCFIAYLVLRQILCWNLTSNVEMCILIPKRLNLCPENLEKQTSMLQHWRSTFEDRLWCYLADHSKKTFLKSIIGNKINELVYIFCFSHLIWKYDKFVLDRQLFSASYFFHILTANLIRSHQKIQTVSNQCIFSCLHVLFSFLVTG